MANITILNGVYKPTYNWAAPHCRDTLGIVKCAGIEVSWMLFFRYPDDKCKIFPCDDLSHWEIIVFWIGNHWERDKIHLAFPPDVYVYVWGEV